MKSIHQIYYPEIPGLVFGTWRLQCHLQIYYPHPEQQTVIVSDVGLETGWFIPYRVESLVDKVVKEFQLNPDSLVWIEHYSQQFRQMPQDDFILISLEWYQGEAMNPQRISIASELACALAGTNLLSKTLQR